MERIKPIFERLEGVRGLVPLRVSGAFHSPHMETAATAFRAFLDSVDFGELRTPVISSVTGRPFEPGQRAVRETLAEQITRPVRWTECVRYMRNAGVTDFVELGGSKVLTSLIDKITAEAGERRSDGDVAPRPGENQQGASNAVPTDAAPWREYRDERVLALLRDCANGTLSVDKVIETIRAGGANHR